MKTEEIKQMAEAKALEKYPKSSNAFIDKLCRGAYAEAIIDTYKEPERVNDKLLDLVNEVLKVWNEDGDNGEIQMKTPIAWYRVVTRAEEAIQSAQQQEKQAKEK